MPDDKVSTFLGVLATGVGAWDEWSELTSSKDDAERLTALRELRAVDARIGEALSQYPVEVARLIVSLNARVEALEGRG